MAGMDVLKEAGKSALGMLEKAYIQIEDNRAGHINVVEKAGQGNMSLADKLFDVSDSSGTNIGSFKLDEIATVRNQVIDNAIKNNMTSIKKYVVRFNPSTLSLNAYGGGRVAKTSFDGGQGKIVYEGMEATIRFNVQLIFDAQSNEDCFMNDIADVKGNIKKGVNVVKQKRNSVQNQVEGFIAALRSPYTRRITFSWGKLAYIGVLTEVDAEYTMFSIHGRPVRAVVNLGMTCMDPSISKNNMGQWTKSYENAFSNKSKTNLESVGQNVGNLLNINL